MKRIFSFFVVLVTLAACESGLEPDKGDVKNPGGTENPGGGDKPDVPEEPQYSYYYQEVTEPLADWEGDYLITYKSSSDIKVFADWDEDAYGQPVAGLNLAEKITENGVPAEEGDPYKSTFTKVGDWYSINVSNVGYIGHDKTTRNTLLASETAPTASDKEYLWTISMESSVWLSLSEESRRLQWNNSAPRFSTYTGSQKELTLYVKVAVKDNGEVVGPVDPDKPDKPDPDKPDPDNPDKPDPDEPDKPDPDQPDIPGGGDPLPNNAKYAWYELPVMNTEFTGQYIVDRTSSPTLYFAYHLCDGSEKDSRGRQARNYTVCYSAEHHCPLWVAAPRHSMYTGSASRTNSYGRDPKIPADIQYSSKSTGGGCNKGHMLGSAERTSSTATNRQVFYYTNIAPQLQSGFNTGGGGWNTLEDWVDTKVCSDTLYEVVGTYFEKYTDGYGETVAPKTISFGGRSDVSCPTMFYYVLLRTKKGNSGKALSQCSSSELQCAAFVRSHTNSLKGQKVSSREMMSVSDLEKITGITYFANVPNAPKDSFKASDWGL